MNQCKSEPLGRIHSFQSLGTVDGPGVRSVIFMQGCPLRCVCCHNPDTWSFEGGTDVGVDELAERVLRYRAYYGEDGGVTVSGGEPLMQAEFITRLFERLKARCDMHTALDTSGCVLNEQVKQLLEMTDLVLLDYKYTDPEENLKNTGSELSRTVEFLDHLEKISKKTWIRHVVIPGLNDSDESVKRVFDLRKKYSCIEKIELLPFRKLCLEKYQELGIPFPLENTPEASQERIDELYRKFE